MSDPMTEVATAADYERRFGGVARLHGAAGLQAFAAASVCVVGIGGVGSWAAEALARSAVGALTLIDLDMIAESNTNRQIHALGDAWGRAKVDAMAERIIAINPACRVRVVEDFVTEENLASLLAGHDAVLDAIDNVRVKTAMVVHCSRVGQLLVVCGGAGGKQDPSRIRVDDLSRTEQDPLLAKVRARLRKEHGFTRDPRRKFGVEAIYSSEPVQMPAMCDPVGPQGLSCAGYGSDVCVTASVGLLASARVLAGLKRIKEES
ncbi:tRNA threonylcarbamoyladenosine dehydratase [Viridibacterium curvum]|uniref:tRNA cyclic N6-threonylcarbamoyladenosine(37) synthase TcdA n=1 Tax=Viridibacterium curvum TaxID=1101404 RepID=A0ABP9QZ89_9RHOO